MTEKISSWENFFLGSLIEDIEEENTQIKESKEIKENIFENNFMEKIKEEENLKISLNYIKKEEIFIYLSNQKTGIQLQNLIKEMNEEEISFIIKELKGFFSKIMKDKNGNYFLKDLFKLCNKEQRLIIFKEILPHFFSFSIHQYATHPIQKLIELINSDEEYNLISSILNLENFINLSINSNGTFVIQKIISIFPEKKREIINNLFIKVFKILVFDMYGVCLLKQFISLTKNEKIHRKIIFSFLQDFEKICENQFGNYFAQFMLELWWDKKEMLIVKNNILLKFPQFSKNKYASHVCEIFLKLSTLQEKQLIFDFLIQNGLYYTLLNDKYGIFVLGKFNCLKHYSNLY